MRVRDRAGEIGLVRGVHPDGLVVAFDEPCVVAPADLECVVEVGDWVVVSGFVHTCSCSDGVVTVGIPVTPSSVVHSVVTPAIGDLVEWAGGIQPIAAIGPSNFTLEGGRGLTTPMSSARLLSPADAEAHRSGVRLIKYVADAPEPGKWATFAGFAHPVRGAAPFVRFGPGVTVSDIVTPRTGDAVMVQGVARRIVAFGRDVFVFEGGITAPLSICRLLTENERTTRATNKQLE